MKTSHRHRHRKRKKNRLPNIPKIVASIKTTPLKKRSTPVVKETIIKFGSQLLDDVGVTDPFNVKSPAIKKYLQNYAAKKIARINKTSQDRVRSMLVKATDEGKSTDQIAKMLADKFDTWSKGRAYTVARTEINSASNFGAHEGMVQAGVEEKEWLATDDDNVRESHQELDGTVVGIDEPFEIDGLEAMYPGDFGDPAEDANCRCGVLPVINDKSLRHKWSLKALERERKPYDKMMFTALSKAFLDQKAAALRALGA